MSEEQDQKDNVEKLIQEIKLKNKRIEDKSRQISIYAQSTNDMVEAGANVIKYINPSGFKWGPMVQSLQNLNEQDDMILGDLDSISIPSATASGTAVAYSMTPLTEPSYFVSFVSFDKKEHALSASHKLEQVLNKEADKNKVLPLLEKYGLATAPHGKKSPVELFETGWAAFESPVTSTSPAVTSLIPIRECINKTIEALLSRRPMQEKAKSEKDKILSICNQLAWNTSQKSAHQLLADQWHTLNDELSGSKEKNFDRDTWLGFLRRATLLLLELLQTLDSSKM